MAIQMGTFLRGKMGDIIFAKRGDTWYARTAPQKMKQAPATKGFSSRFGRAARIAKCLREQLGNVILCPGNKKMQNSWGGAITKWLYRCEPGTNMPLDSLPFISGFVFNEARGNTRKWMAALTVTQPNENELALQVPAFVPNLSFSAPAGTVLVNCRVTVAYCKPRQPVAPTAGVTMLLQIPFNGEPVAAQVISLLLPSVAECLWVTAVGICFTDARGNRIAINTYLPSMVIDARYC